MVKFKVNKKINVYINEYSIVKDYPEIKLLDRTLKKKRLFKILSNNVNLIKNKNKQIINNDLFKLIASSTLSLGILGSISYINSKREEQQLKTQLDSVARLSSELDISLIKSDSNDTLYIDIQKQIAHFQKQQVIQNLTKQTISERKVKLTNQTGIDNSVIREYADMYFMNYDTVKAIYNDNYNEIINSDNSELSLLLKVKDAFYSNDSIDKTSIITNLSPEEKEAYIIKIAKEVYKVEDEDTYALLLAIYRLETGHGTSKRCVQDNNPGGVREGTEFLTFKTFEIGVECFVRNTLKVRDLALADDSNLENVVYSMQPIYCPGEIAWAIEVESIKNSILDDNELDNYLDNNKKYIK